MIIDKIDKYLAGEMTTEERASFEKEIEHDAKLREDVRIIAFIIHGIKQVGLEEDNQRLQRLIASSASDKQRYIATIAAIFIAGFIIAATISVPIYNHVVKPLIEKVSKNENSENNNPVHQKVDSLFYQDEADSIKTTIDNSDNKPSNSMNNNDDEDITANQQSNTIEEENEQKETDNKIEEIQDQVSQIGNSLAIDIGENGTKYVIEQAKIINKELIVTILISNNENDAIVHLTNASTVDSYGNTVTGNTPERFILSKGTSIKKQIHFYNLSKQPDFLQILKMNEVGGKVLKFRNIPIS